MNGNGDSGEDRPLDAINRLDQEVSPEFIAGVRNKIERRRVGAHVLLFSWDAIRVVLLEFLELIFGLIGMSKNDQGGKE